MYLSLLGNFMYCVLYLNEISPFRASCLQKKGPQRLHVIWWTCGTSLHSWCFNGFLQKFTWTCREASHDFLSGTRVEDRDGSSSESPGTFLMVPVWKTLVEASLDSDRLGLLYADDLCFELGRKQHGRCSLAKEKERLMLQNMSCAA